MIVASRVVGVTGANWGHYSHFTGVNLKGGRGPFMRLEINTRVTRSNQDVRIQTWSQCQQSFAISAAIC